ncbi:Homeobox domain [Dillenia turbinata]|uniref:Homeobox domain n=1 Tax=Dillenia turbinata TaxID=194707 RepID=A0AAN8VBE4_9MAGN
MRNFDINQVPCGGGEEEWNTSGLSMDDEEEVSANNNNNDEGVVPPRKKLRLSKEQTRLLEESFRQNHTLDPKQKEALTMQLRLKPRQIEVWFQNRRARSKLKQTEMECEYLKRWFGSLREQNRRLQKEVEELRAMKVGPPTVLSPHTCEPLPASTLTMCPRCERITSTAATSSTSPATAPVDKGPTTTSTLSSKVPSIFSRQTSAACKSPSNA